MKAGTRRVRRAPWYLVTGAVAGFAGVLGLHGRAVTPVALGHLRPAAGQARKAAASGARRSATGTVEQYGYGELAVTVTVTGHQITRLSVPLLRTAEPYSQQIAVQVIPMLKSEVLAAGSPRINAVSGATYTSEAYAASIQSALDKLHIR